MNRREFIARLKEEISRLPQEEIEAAAEYYEEYFDEAGADKEQDVLERLGSPKKVASQIKSEYAVRLFDEEEKPTVKKGLSAAWYVVLGICSAPVSIPLAVALGALAISIFVALICCVIGVFAGIAGCVLGAIACIVVGILAIPVSISTAAFLMGIGLVGLSFMVAMGALLAMGVKAGTAAIVKTARRQNERRRIRKALEAGERKKWRYRDEQEGGEKDA